MRYSPRPARTAPTAIALQPGELRLADLRRIARFPLALTLADGDRQAIADSAAIVARIVREGATVYAVNPGLGKLAEVSIPPDQLEELQHNLVLSHCAGIGAPLGDDVVRLAMALKINCLAQARSGVRPIVVDALLRLLDAAVYPVIPSKGSVGASGDLAPLGHLAAARIGVGAVRQDG